MYGIDRAESETYRITLTCEIKRVESQTCGIQKRHHMEMQHMEIRHVETRESNMWKSDM